MERPFLSRNRFPERRGPNAGTGPLPRSEQFVERERLVEGGGGLPPPRPPPPRPLVPAPIPGQLEVVPVRVAQVDRQVRAVVGQLSQRHPCIDQPPHDLRKLLFRREVERDVVEPRNAVWLRVPAGGFPGV